MTHPIFHKVNVTPFHRSQEKVGHPVWCQIVNDVQGEVRNDIRSTVDVEKHDAIGDIALHVSHTIGKR